MTPDIDARARRLRLLLFDVDGVMTDGRILLHSDGTESKQFHIRDGTALVWARRAGLLTGLLSARSSATTALRAQQLGIPIVKQGVEDKLSAYDAILAEHGLTDDQVSFMGDDVLDLPVLTRVGLACAPADSVLDVRSRVHWVSEARGGEGAIREFIDLVLRVQGQWPELLGSYLPAAPVGESSEGETR